MIAFFIVFVIQIFVAKKFNSTNTFRSPTPPTQSYNFLQEAMIPPKPPSRLEIVFEQPLIFQPLPLYFKYVLYNEYKNTYILSSLKKITMQ